MPASLMLGDKARIRRLSAAGSGRVVIVQVLRQAAFSCPQVGQVACSAAMGKSAESC